MRKRVRQPMSESDRGKDRQTERARERETVTVMDRVKDRESESKNERVRYRPQ